jgi:hypothetical protein
MKEQVEEGLALVDAQVTKHRAKDQAILERNANFVRRAHSGNNLFVNDEAPAVILPESLKDKYQASPRGKHATEKEATAKAKARAALVSPNKALGATALPFITAVVANKGATSFVPRGASLGEGDINKLVRLQAFVRAYMAKQLVCNILYQRYMKEHTQLEDKQRLQTEEGMELLAHIEHEKKMVDEVMLMHVERRRQSLVGINPFPVDGDTEAAALRPNSAAPSSASIQSRRLDLLRGTKSEAFLLSPQLKNTAVLKPVHFNEDAYGSRGSSADSSAGSSRGAASKSEINVEEMLDAASRSRDVAQTIDNPQGTTSSCGVKKDKDRAKLKPQRQELPKELLPHQERRQKQQLLHACQSRNVEISTSELDRLWPVHMLRQRLRECTKDETALVFEKAEMQMQSDAEKRDRARVFAERQWTKNAAETKRQKDVEDERERDQQARLHWQVRERRKERLREAKVQERQKAGYDLRRQQQRQREVVARQEQAERRRVRKVQREARNQREEELQVRLQVEMSRMVALVKSATVVDTGMVLGEGQRVQQQQRRQQQEGEEQEERQQAQAQAQVTAQAHQKQEQRQQKKHAKELSTRWQQQLVHGGSLGREIRGEMDTQDRWLAQEIHMFQAYYPAGAVHNTQQLSGRGDGQQRGSEETRRLRRFRERERKESAQQERADQRRVQEDYERRQQMRQWKSEREQRRQEIGYIDVYGSLVKASGDQYKTSVQCDALGETVLPEDGVEGKGKLDEVGGVGEGGEEWIGGWIEQEEERARKVKRMQAEEEATAHAAKAAAQNAAKQKDDELKGRQLSADLERLAKLQALSSPALPALVSASSTSLSTSTRKGLESLNQKRRLAAPRTKGKGGRPPGGTTANVESVKSANKRTAVPVNKKPIGQIALMKSIEVEAQAALERVVGSMKKTKVQAQKRCAQHQRFWDTKHAGIRRKGLDEHLAQGKLKASPFALPLRQTL